MTDKIFEPYWEKDGAKLFSSFDVSKIETPAYVVDLGVLENNLKILAEVKKRTGAKILLALKSFAMFSTFPLIRKYLDGVCASSVNEARLGKEKFGKEVHTFAPAYSDKDIKEHLKYSDHIVFNSFQLLDKYKSAIKNKNRNIEIGIRINPEAKGADNDLYNPCAPCSRMGVTIDEFEPDKLDGVSGLHFHALCEQGADDLANVLKHVENKFGPYISKMKWINFGGGHHITRSDYDVDLLCKLITDFKKKYDVDVTLEPGEAVALNAGVLVTSVLDIIKNDMEIAILDSTAEAHMPDVLAMPYRPTVIGAEKPSVKKHTYRLGGVTCLSGDIIGDYSFDNPLRVGSKLVFANQAIYTMVKNTTFNGVRLPSIILREKDGKLKVVKRFGYEDFERRLS
ncbi:MAG: carboxynorspermidine decarboxylase [Candidatus Aenigmarchaeota archaeon]|nr:carboxynorspermidine decarboxylase [Candidatus Aenigmarchaeota archaeon]